MPGSRPGVYMVYPGYHGTPGTPCTTCRLPACTQHAGRAPPSSNGPWGSGTATDARYQGLSTGSYGSLSRTARGRILRIRPRMSPRIQDWIEPGPGPQAQACRAWALSCRVWTSQGRPNGPAVHRPALPCAATSASGQVRGVPGPRGPGTGGRSIIDLPIGDHPGKHRLPG